MRTILNKKTSCTQREVFCYTRDMENNNENLITGTRRADGAARTDRQMYLYGRRESTRNHRNPEHDDLTYWDHKLRGEANYKTAFLDGWTDGATGDNEYAHLYT